MNRSIRTFAAAALAFGAIGAATAAHARTDVYFSLGVPAYVESAPVYVQPQPVYVEPAQVYVPAPAPVYGYAYDNAWRRAEWRREQWRREHWRHEQWEREHGDRRGWHGRDWD
jgi:hypothetical protein